MVGHRSTPLTQSVDRISLAKFVATIVLLLAAAAMVTISILHRTNDSDGTVYFYDLSQQKLFAAPRSSVPPIRGIDNDEPIPFSSRLVKGGIVPMDSGRLQIGPEAAGASKLRVQLASGLAGELKP